MPRNTLGMLRQWLIEGIIADNKQAGPTRYLKVTVLVLAITLLGVLLDLRAAPTNLAMIYLLGTVFVSYRWGFGPALTYSSIAAFTFDFLFIPPYKSFTFTDIWYLITTSTLIVVSLFIAILTTGIRQKAVAAGRREAQTAILYALMQALAPTHGSAEVLRAAAVQFRATFGFEIAILLVNDSGGLVTQREPTELGVDTTVQSAAERILTAAQKGAIHRSGAFLPLRAGPDVIGVIVMMHDQLPPLGSDDDLVLEAMAGQVALAIKRATLEERARKAEREQQSAEQAKAEAIATLAGGLAHDLNNLLTGVLGNASLVADSLPAHHSARTLLGNLVESGERAAHIVAQVLSYAGKSRFVNEPIDLSVLVRGFVKCLPPTPEQIELSVQLEDHLPLLKGDRNQLLQLIGNLYLNAVEAIDRVPGRIVISTYRLDSRRQDGTAFSDSPLSTDDYVCLRVTDTGCGIDESIRTRIFDPFFTTKFIGRGLGLSAAQGIARAHNGVIRVISDPGKGSTFTCLFAV